MVNYNVQVLVLSLDLLMGAYTPLKMQVLVVIEHGDLASKHWVLVRVQARSALVDYGRT